MVHVNRVIVTFISVHSICIRTSRLFLVDLLVLLFYDSQKFRLLVKKSHLLLLLLLYHLQQHCMVQLALYMEEETLD